MAIEILNSQGRVIYTHQGGALSGADLSEANLSGANLRDADLSRTNLSRTNLRCADLRGAYLNGVNLGWANLSGADLSDAKMSGADLSEANLSGANLRDADLSRCDLSRCDLSGAKLSGADLSRCDLSGAKLSGAKGYDSRRANPLHFLNHQIHPLIAYKLVTEDYTGPFYAGIEYRVGAEVSVEECVEEWDSDPANDCGPGINLATLGWVLREWRNGYRVLQVECYPAEGICVPDASDGKFRVKRCKILKEMDLVELEVGKFLSAE